MDAVRLRHPGAAIHVEMDDAFRAEMLHHGVVRASVLSYVIDAFSGVSAPTDALASQKVALARLFFYRSGTLWVTPTVTAECARIRNVSRSELHASFISVLFGELPVADSSTTKGRATVLRQHHAGQNDCAIVAEAEAVGHSVLLSFDSSLVRHLASHTAVQLVEPLEYWNALSIPRGARPDKEPHSTNPLSSQAWWRW
jgi:hypothetical protein